ncbi:hypothetical protein [Lignipirellula cremea]|uniref:Uncharacterized protein n=1 Tax=Lignipirellula cremea TaxID=2528010 RepID=A0A518E3V9_9BACT|nr:hypothetical protein [Lignipirellula cremea]QDU98779.1 hypothetical protein Pla8534_66530 [Lignipirellula cremea]
MELLIETTGNVRCIYAEAVELHAMGRVTISRGSHVEPTTNGCWTADLSPVNGPVLGPFPARTQALKAEHAWLLRHWLTPSK